jgi:hypothetical protein
MVMGCRIMGGRGGRRVGVIGRRVVTLVGVRMSVRFRMGMTMKLLVFRTVPTDRVMVDHDMERQEQ